MMNDKFSFNPTKRSSASTLSGHVYRIKSKIIIALPASNNHVESFLKIHSGGFSCVNTRLAFDTETLMANCLLKNRSSIHLNQDEDFKSHKRDDLKVIYNFKLDSDKKYEKDAL